jgi:putative ABC transport system permease protein
MATVKRIGPLTWAIRAKSQASSLTEAVRHEIESTAGLSADRARWMDQVIYQSTARDRFNALLLVIFAAVAILLASIGLYGVISYSIKQRAQEFGIRLALGASPSHLRIRIVGQAMTLAIIGILIGSAGAVALTGLIASMLFGITATDPQMFMSVTLLILVIAFLASLGPARKAARVDPLEALRSE